MDNGLEPDNEQASERRQFGRIRQDELRCNLGHVLDVSRGGIRLVTSRRLRNHCRVVLATSLRPAMRLRAEVAWRKRLGIGEFAVGLRFVDVDAEQARWLTELAHHDCTHYASRAREARRSAARAERLPLTLPIGLTLLALAAIVHRFHTPEAFEGWPVIEHPLTPVVVGAALGAVGGTMVALWLGRLIAAVVKPRGRRAKSPNVLGELYSLRHLLRCVLDSSLSGVMVLQAVRNERRQLVDFEVQMTSTAVEHLLGRSEQELVGQRVSAALGWLFDDELFNTLAGILDSGLPYQEDRWWPQQQRWLQLSAVRLSDSVTLSFADVTEQKQHATRMKHEALHDALTGLPNRKAITDLLTSVIADRARRGRYAVLFLDFDGFKRVNDTMGHEVGDQLLVSIAERLRAVLAEREADRTTHPRATPARLGGDEFVVLLEDLDDTAHAERIAQKLVAEFTGPVTLAGRQVLSTASIGVVTSDLNHATAQDVLRDADAAMYQAKQAGKSRCRVFDRRMHDQATRQQHFERDLREAIVREQLELAYQPVIDVESSRVLGVEALLRWQHPQRGEVPPGQFLTVAEQIGLIEPLGLWVIRRACRDLARWRKRFADRHDLFVTVNLTRRQLLDPALPQAIRDTLREFHVPARCLWLEVTEQAVTRETGDATAALLALKNIGVRLALDDFGAGHTTFHALHALPFDVIKIDPHLIHSRPEDRRRFAGILHAILDLAHNLDLTVVAKGVESGDQLALLQGLDCPQAQGWLFARALPAEEVTQLLRATDAVALRERLRPASAA